MTITTEEKQTAQEAISQLQPLIDAHKNLRGGPGTKDVHARDHILPVAKQYWGLACQLGNRLSDELAERSLAAILPFCESEIEARGVAMNLTLCVSIREGARHLQHHSQSLDNVPGLARSIVKILTRVLDAAGAV